MEPKFKMVVHHNSENLHVKLIGDFDMQSADRLIKLIGRYKKRVRKIFVHTNCLGNIEPVGTDAFHKNNQFSAETLTDLVFTGDHAERIAPYAWQVL